MKNLAGQAGCDSVIAIELAQDTDRRISVPTIGERCPQECITQAVDK